MPSDSIYNRYFAVDGFILFLIFVFLAPKSLSPCKQGRRERKGSRGNPRCLFNVILGKTMICGPRPSSSEQHLLCLLRNSKRNTWRTAAGLVWYFVRGLISAGGSDQQPTAPEFSGPQIGPLGN